MDFSNQNCRCLVCSTEIAESSNKLFESAQNFDKSSSLLLSSLWNCLDAHDSHTTTEDSKNEVTGLDPKNPGIRFCNCCEKYLTEFDQLSKEISMLHMRVNTVKFTVIARVLAATTNDSEIQVESAASSDDRSLLWNYTKLSHFRRVLKQEFNPNVRLSKLTDNLIKKSSSSPPDLMEELSKGPFFEPPADYQDVDQESCHDSVHHDDADDQDYEPFNSGHDDDDDGEVTVPKVNDFEAPGENRTPKRSRPAGKVLCKEISPNEFLYAGKFKFSFDGTQYRCRECSDWVSSSVFKSRNWLSRHFRTAHASPTALTSAGDGKIQGTSSPAIRHYECKGIAFTYDPTVERYCCGVCPANLKVRSSIRSHIKLIHLGQPGHYICEVCGDAFQNEPYLRKHHRQVHGEPRHKCPHCDKLFRNRKNFNAHVTLHELGPEEARKFVCEYCGKTFHRRRYLVKHVRIHTGEKPLSCDLCDEKFADTGKRSYHKRTVHKVFSKKKEQVPVE